MPVNRGALCLNQDILLVGRKDVATDGGQAHVAGRGHIEKGFHQGAVLERTTLNFPPVLAQLSVCLAISHCTDIANDLCTILSIGYVLKFQLLG